MTPPQAGPNILAVQGQVFLTSSSGTLAIKGSNDTNYPAAINGNGVIMAGVGSMNATEAPSTFQQLNQITLSGILESDVLMSGNSSGNSSTALVAKAITLTTDSSFSSLQSNVIFYSPHVQNNGTISAGNLTFQNNTERSLLITSQFGSIVAATVNFNSAFLLPM